MCTWFNAWECLLVDVYRLIEMKDTALCGNFPWCTLSFLFFVFGAWSTVKQWIIRISRYPENGSSSSPFRSWKNVKAWLLIDLLCICIYTYIYIFVNATLLTKQYQMTKGCLQWVHTGRNWWQKLMILFSKVHFKASWSFPLAVNDWGVLPSLRSALEAEQPSA